MSEDKKNFFEKLTEWDEIPISRRRALKEAGKVASAITIFSTLFDACARLSEEAERGMSEEEKKKISEFIENLGENEKQELQRRFIDYKNVYKIYNNLAEDDNIKDGELFYKFYGIFYKYCPNFSYKEKHFLNGKDRAFLQKEDGRYTIFYLQKKIKDNENTLTNPEIFDYIIYAITHPEKYKEPEQKSNLKQLIAELSHLVDFHFNSEGSNKRMYSKEKELEVIKNYFPKFEYLGFSDNDILIKTRIKDLIRYFHIEFDEFYTHQVEERAIWAYLLDILPGKSLEDIREIYILIFKKVKNYFSLEEDNTGNTKDSGDSSRFAKAAIYSALSMPEWIKQIANHHTRIKPKTYIDFILDSFNSLKNEIIQKQVDVDLNYLFFELLNHTTTQEEIESILHIQGLINAANLYLVQRNFIEEEFNQFSEPKKILIAILAKGIFYAEENIPNYIQKYQKIGNFNLIDDFLKKQNQLLLE